MTAQILLADFNNNISLSHLPALFRASAVESAVLAKEDHILLHTNAAKHYISIPKSAPFDTFSELANTFSSAERQTNAQFFLTNDEILIRNLLKIRDRLRHMSVDGTERQKAVLALLERSFLADTNNYGRARLLEHAKKAGFIIPDYATAASWEAAEALVKDLPKPFYLKVSFEAGGIGVARIENDDDYSKASHFMHTTCVQPDAGCPIVFQQPVSGQELTLNFSAWNGTLLGYDVLKPLTRHRDTGPSCVLQSLYRPHWAPFLKALVKNIGYSGFGGLDVFEKDPKTAPTAIEVNLRPPHGLQISRHIKSNLISRFSHCLLTGELPEIDQCHHNHTKTVAIFPDEVFRDPKSIYLEEYPVCIPWDDPTLCEKLFELAAMKSK
ncbi:hypothetical protein [Sneathiella aquimaris]|uniref:hypothetical protein n=1 Tax=Sneathiella aquimaris TaxID=2599305 RepID=UPI00146C8A84|nr:hypothetical protein [Sneathiella aquimaris]